MSLLLLIDGYNLVAPVAPPGNLPDPRWLQRERMRLLRRLSDYLPEEVRRRCCVVFDAASPPPDRPHQFQFEAMEVQFAVGYPEADDLLEEIIASHSAPKMLAVISSDHRIQEAARRRGAAWFDSEPWLDQLLDGRVALADGIHRKAIEGSPESGAGQGSAESTKPRAPDDEEDVQQWMRDFGF